MSKIGTISFKNAQGHAYDFSIFPMDAIFKPGHGGAYIVTSRHDESDKHHHGHHIILIDETDDMSTVFANHINQPEFDAQNANCCCVHATQDSAARKRIVEELSSKYL